MEKANAGHHKARLSIRSYSWDWLKEGYQGNLKNLLMADQQQLGFSSSLKHQNNGLFSDYYLNERVRVQFENDLTLRNEAATVFGEIKQLRERCAGYLYCLE